METSMRAVHPFSPNRGHTGFTRFFNALLATALARCWHIVLFFTGWATMVSLVSRHGHSLAIQSTLLTVMGTALGFIISLRTTSSFERYNEGRKFWSQIILGSRNLARTIWFHVPDNHPLPRKDNYPGVGASADNSARVLLEKKTVINLIEAFAVAVKHYLRHEEGVNYVDLYHLVKYLPQYALPPGMPSATDLPITDEEMASLPPPLSENGSSEGTLPPPVTSPASTRRISHAPSENPPRTPRVRTFNEKGSLVSVDENVRLLPARNPPKYRLFDLFPFSLLVRALTKRGHDLKSKEAAEMQAELRGHTVTHNIPLEISLYLSSYVAALQTRDLAAPTATALMNSVTQLVDALTGLERILTTPIPFSYQAHLWTVTTLYCLLLPFQIWTTLGWLTIPATTLVSFIFIGFLVAGEEIENPFDYDKHDLNMDHFTQNIIRRELHAITALPTPQLKDWVFSPLNDQVFSRDERVTPEDWVRRGLPSIQSSLASVHKPKK